MIQTQRAQNPLFLRDAELERSLALLTLLDLELAAAIAPTLERHDLEPAEAVLLIRIDQAAAAGEPLTAAELAAFLGWTKQRVSRRLQTLAARGLVERQGVVGDRRKQHVVASEAGRRQAAEMKTLQLRLLRRVFRRAGPADVAGFQHVLAVAAQHASRARQGAPAAVPANASPEGGS